MCYSKSLQRIFIIVAAVIALLFSSCKTSKIESQRSAPADTPDVPKTDDVLGDIDDAGGDYDDPFTYIDPGDPIDGSDLDTGNVQTTVDTDTDGDGNSHSSLDLSVEPSGDTDYLQYAICKTGSESECNPSKDQPGTFASTSLKINNPMAGKVDVWVRACVAPNQSKDFRKNCGLWTKKIHFQPGNEDNALSRALNDIAEAELAILHQCKLIKNDIDEYRKNSKKEGNEASMRALAENYSNFIPPEVCQEIMLSEDFDVIADAIGQASDDRGAGEAKSSAGIIGLGSIGVILGLTAGGVALFRNNKFFQSKMQTLANLLPIGDIDDITTRALAVDDIEFNRKINADLEFRIKSQINALTPKDGKNPSAANQKRINELNQKLEKVDKNIKHCDEYKKFNEIFSAKGPDGKTNISDLPAEQRLKYILKDLIRPSDTAGIRKNVYELEARKLVNDYSNLKVSELTIPLVGGREVKIGELPVDEAKKLAGVMDIADGKITTKPLDFPKTSILSSPKTAIKKFGRNASDTTYKALTGQATDAFYKNLGKFGVFAALAGGVAIAVGALKSKNSSDDSSSDSSMHLTGDTSSMSPSQLLNQKLRNRMDKIQELRSRIQQLNASIN